MISLLLRTLLLFAFISSLNADEHRTQNNLIPTLSLKSKPMSFSENSAVAFLGEVGNRNYRINGTLGFLLGDRDRFKASAEYLQQKLGYKFSSGTEHEWMRQYAFGVAYRHDFCNGCFKSLDLEGYGSFAPSKTLADEDFFNRRIAGSTACGVALGSRIIPWNSGCLAFDIDYDFVSYRRKYESYKKVSGIGGSLKFNQRITETLGFNLLAEVKRPYNYYRAGLNWNPCNCRDLVIGLYASHTQGKYNLPSNTVVGLELNFSFLDYSYGRKSDYDCCERSSNDCCFRQDIWSCRPELACWVITPAVYLPEVLAIAEETLSCRSPPLILAPIPNAFITDFGSYSIDTAQYFTNTENAVFSATGLPPGTTINPETGVIDGVYIPVVEVFSVTVTVQNGCGIAAQSFTISFTPECPGGVPTSVPIPDFSTTAPGAYIYDVSSYFTNPVGASPLVFSAVGLPLGSSIDPVTGVITGTNLQEGIVSVVTVTAENTCGSTSQPFTLSLLCPGAPTSTPIPDFTTDAPGVVNYDVSSFFTNTMGASPLVFSATGLPLGFSIDPVTGIISGINPQDDSSSLVTVTATNNCGETSQSFTLNLNCPGAPTSTPIPDLSTCVPGLVVYNVGPFFTNTVGATPLVFSATGLPVGFVIDPDTGLITGNNPNDTLTYTVTVTATNNCGETSQSFDMTFPCPAPESTPVPDLIDPSLGGDPYSYDVSPYFTSPCGQTITFSAIGLPPGSSINPATGVISGTTNGSQVWNVTVTATTICGQTSQSFTMDFSSD